MHRRSLTFRAAALVASLAASLMMAQPAAAARAYCEFWALDSFGNVMARGWAFAARTSWACNRAERRCKRNMKGKPRPFRGCHRMRQAR